MRTSGSMGPVNRPTDLTVRPCVEADLSTIVGLRDAAARWQLGRGIRQWTVGEVTIADLRSQVAEGLLFTAVRGDAVVGSVRLQWTDPQIWGEDPENCAGYLHGLITDRSGTGIGAGLIRWVEEQILAVGRTRCRLDCVASNPALRAYYRARGYQDRGEFRPTQQGWQPLQRFEKELTVEHRSS